LSNRLFGIQNKNYALQHARRNFSLWISLALLIIILMIYQIKSESVLNEFQIKVLINGGMALSFASIGLAMAIISGGFDVSVGSIITLVNVIASITLKGQVFSDIQICLVLLLLGTLLGAVNGFLIAYAGIQPIIATLASNFVWFGVSLLLLPKPGGYIPQWINVLFQGTYIKRFPNAIFWLILLIIFIIYFQRTKFCRSIFAIGSDPEAACRNGINIKFTLLKVYGLAGLFYGISGIFLTAQTTSGDPNIGIPFMLLSVAAVVVGGTPFGGGRGSLFSGITGAYIIRLLDSVLISIGITSYFNDIFQGSILLIAVAVSSLMPKIKMMIHKRRRGEKFD